MNNNPKCPICRADAWDILDRKEYELDSKSATDSYWQARKEVLFDIWFPNQTSVSLESLMCKPCGFVCYRPRPEAIDIERKYTYLAEHKTANKEFSFQKASDLTRSKELYSYLKPYLGRERRCVLDYGGGNGRLLHTLLEKGHACSIVELVDETLPGITYLGDQISSAVDVGSFDVIVCSHVLEHVVNPVETVAELSGAVRDGGYIYIEVPHELWREAPPKIEPVTHINFFSTDSVETLLGEVGLHIVCCDYKTFTRPNGLVGIAIKAIAQKRTNDVRVPVKYGGTDLGLSQINASWLGKFVRLLRYPSLILNFFRKPEV